MNLVGENGQTKSNWDAPIVLLLQQMRGAGLSFPLFENERNRFFVPLRCQRTSFVSLANRGLSEYSGGRDKNKHPIVDIDKRADPPVSFIDTFQSNESWDDGWNLSLVIKNRDGKNGSALKSGDGQFSFQSSISPAGGDAQEMAMAILRPTRYILLISDSDKGARKRAEKKNLWYQPLNRRRKNSHTNTRTTLKSFP